MFFSQLTFYFCRRISTNTAIYNQRTHCRTSPAYSTVCNKTTKPKHIRVSWVLCVCVILWCFNLDIRNTKIAPGLDERRNSHKVRGNIVCKRVCVCFICGKSMWSILACAWPPPPLRSAAHGWGRWMVITGADAERTAATVKWCAGASKYIFYKCPTREPRASINAGVCVRWRSGHASASRRRKHTRAPILLRFDLHK